MIHTHQLGDLFWADQTTSPQAGQLEGLHWYQWKKNRPTALGRRSVTAGTYLLVFCLKVWSGKSRCILCRLCKVWSRKSRFFFFFFFICLATQRWRFSSWFLCKTFLTERVPKKTLTRPLCRGLAQPPGTPKSPPPPVKPSCGSVASNL